MYLNKRIYLACRSVSVFCFWLFGYTFCLMTMGLIMDIKNGEGVYLNEAIIKPYLIIFCLVAGFYYFKHMIEQAKLYDSFFAEDMDGILYSHVLAKAIGVQEKKVIEELHFLEKLHLFKLSMEPVGEHVQIMLYQPYSKNGNGQIYQQVTCPNCGAINRVRKGFVYTCSYCLGSLENSHGSLRNGLGNMENSLESPERSIADLEKEMTGDVSE